MGKKPVVHIIDKKYHRNLVFDNIDTLYIFTDNNERTSRPNAEYPNIIKGWYAKKYKNTTKYPLHYGSLKNPTSAVIRGLNNAYPISTMKGYGRQWELKDFELFKKVLKDEIKTIKKALKQYKYLVYPSGIGQKGRFAKIHPKLQKWLDHMLLKHLNIINQNNSFSTT